MKAVKAAVCRAFGSRHSIEPVTLAPPGPGEVEVRIRACAVCHSDIAFIDGHWGGALPAVFGHEASGVVERTGEGVRHLTAGQHAVVTLVRACGRCACCEGGLYGSCEAHFPLADMSPLTADDGSPLHQGLRTAAFAERVVVDASQVVGIEPDLPFEAAALLACGVITGVGAVTNTARVPVGASVVVIGCGGVGLNSIQGARLSGAGRIIAVDVAAAKLEAARRFGASKGIDARQEDPVDRVRALTGRRGADFVFVAVGAGAAFEQALDMIAPGGALVIVGMPPEDVRIAFEPVTLASRSQRILGSKMGAANIHQEIPKLIDLYRQKRLLLDEMISGRFPLEGLDDAISSVKRGEALRNVILFD